jgi:exopolysaccharide biosynthesis polyprenyl glycosylphosphotransferase
MNKTLQVLKYITLDLISASLAWSLFFIFRKRFLEKVRFGEDIPFEFDTNFYIGLIVVPLGWLVFYTATGFYTNIYRKSRLKELGQTLLTTLIGTLFIFFVLLLDDELVSYKHYYKSFLAIFSLHFLLTFVLRFILSTKTAHRIQRREIGFNTLIVGSNEKAMQLFTELENEPSGYGHKLVGFARVNGGKPLLLETQLPDLGSYKMIKNIVTEHQIEEVIIAIESSEHENIGRIINDLEGTKVLIKVIPDIYDILSGSVKMTTIFGAPLIVVNSEIMPPWQQTSKRALDIISALFVLLFFSPVFLVTALIVKLSSRGPAIFSQERIGQHGKPFMIYKFRSMYTDAEKNGPALSSENDNRITKFGRFMRKTRLDEIPQFYNVLVGDMSLVGPRPERKFYIDRIVEKAGHYNHLLKVRPGITSWGQVKYGYAENVDQMIERLKFDVLYIENMSLIIDFKILIYTILTVLKGSGR